MKYLRLLLYLFIVLEFVALHGEAGILMINTNETYDMNKEKITSRVYVDKDRIRVDSQGTKIDNTFIYRRDKEVFWTIDNKEKTYMEITRADMLGMKKKMDEAMNKMKEQMKNMPPDERAMMEKMMKGQMPFRPEEPIYKKRASGIIVNKWNCDKYEGYMDGKKAEEIWTTDWEKLGLKREDLEVMEGLGGFFGEFSREQHTFYKVGSQERGYAGIPIRTITYSNGKIMDKTELKEIRKQNFASSLFNLPKGFKKNEYPGIR